MSQEEVKRLEQDAKSKAEVRDKLKGAGTETAKLATVAASMGYDVSEDDLNQFIAAKKDAMSPDELDKVAGGAGTDAAVTTTTTTVESVGVEAQVEVTIGPATVVVST